MRLPGWLDSLTRRQRILAATLLATGMELLTLAMRFGAQLQSTRDTASLSRLTCGIRVHHGYVGAALLLVALWRAIPPGWRNLLIVTGAALLLSDLVHHFLVLWPLTGSPEFDLVYPTP